MIVIQEGPKTSPVKKSHPTEEVKNSSKHNQTSTRESSAKNNLEIVRSQEKEFFAKRAPTLEMAVLEGTPFSELRRSLLEPGTAVSEAAITINSFGLEPPSRRNARDRTVFFGTQDEKVVVNDVLLPDDSGFGKKHFFIKYLIESNEYVVKDMGDGTGTFIKIISPIILSSGLIISFGESHMVVGINEKNASVSARIKNSELNFPVIDEKGGIKEGEPHLVVQFIDGPKAKEVFRFRVDDVPVTIGRSEKCKIKFPGSSLSRTQCQIDYLDEKWILRDGDGGKSSTNGTWLFAEDEQKIEDGMILKAGQSLFKISLSTQNAGEKK